MPNIVVVNVSQTIAPTPNKLQKMGAILSMGGTNQSQGNYGLLTEPSSLTPLLASPIALSALTWSSGVATATTASTTVAATGSSYDSGTGVVTLNLTADIGLSPGSSAVVSSLTGTGGDLADADGTFTAIVGTLGTTLEYTIATSLTISSITGGTVKIGHGITVGDTFLTTIAGVVPAVYNGTFLATATTATAFTYQLAANPGGSATTEGTYTPRNVAEIQAAVDTFFGQGSIQPVYVLEFGKGEPSTAITYFAAWLVANPGVFYSYLIPHSWDALSGFLALVALYEAPTAKTYFFTSTTLQNYGAYTDLMKDVVALVPAPATGAWPANVLTGATYSSFQATFTTTTAHGVAVGQWFKIAGMTPAGYNGWFQAVAGTTGSTLVANVPAAIGAESVLGTLVAQTYAQAAGPTTEFAHAADWRVTLNYDPTSTNKVTPFNLAFLFGVTPFPTPGNSSLLTTLSTANINYIGTGAEGGISDTILVGGHTMDGNPFNYWYSVDWTSINLDLNLANAVINGSNNPVNPLYYNQDGINRLQAVAARTMNTGVTNGLALGTVIQTELSAGDLAAALDAGTFAGNIVVNAEPFTTYSTENPNDYGIGKYGGLTIVYTPARGFEQIIVQLNVTNFVA